MLKKKKRKGTAERKETGRKRTGVTRKGDRGREKEVEKRTRALPNLFTSY